MREILFRGKNKRYGWIYGSLVADSVQDSSCAIIAWASENHKYDTGEFLVTPETVGQYTGLKDKNGKKIFEGDIVNVKGQWWDACGPAGHDSPILKVEWDDSLGGFQPFVNYDCDCGIYLFADESEIIGNIYDNPELLEVGE